MSYPVTWTSLHSRLYPNNTVIHTENYTYQEITDYLILDKFIMSNSISDIDCENWENRNTQFAKKWLSWRNDLEDFIPPP